jgi:hypothetical protein
MRLLKRNGCGEISLTDVFHEELPRYAILSHTWGLDKDELTFDDLQSGKGESKAGYTKLRFCAEQAKQDGLEYFWVDTCCINKRDLHELSKSITSMFRWYRDAAKCYVYLSDVSLHNDDDHQTKLTWDLAFRKCRWFTRGWTLQELIAPAAVEFFSKEWEHLGSKETLEALIHAISGIPIMALRGTPLSCFSVEERMRWSANRATKEKEDKAYCLLGIFNVFMPLIYGEGENAFERLKRKIDKNIMGK